MKTDTNRATRTLTRQQVEASPLLTRQVREQAAYIRSDVAEHGVVRFVGRGYHRHDADCRDFALRVMVAKGELVQTGRTTWHAA